MLNYIFKCTTGSFGRTIGRILAYIAIGVLILFLGSFINIGNVKAESEAGMLPTITYNPVFGTNIDSYVQFKDLKTGTIYGSDADLWGLGGGTEIGYNWRRHDLPMGSTPSSKEGIAISSCGNSFVKNNYYSIIIYYVTKGDFFVHNTYAENNNKVGLGLSWPSSFSNFSIVPTTYFTGVENSKLMTNYDYYVTFNSITFKADKDASCVAWPVNKFGGGLAYGNFEYVGSRILYQGTEPPSNDEVTSLITQESAIINSNIDSMKEKQDETNQKLQETNDYLKDDTPPDTDISSLGNVQGLLPPGPLDSLLNIPFNFLSIVVSSLSGTCVPLESTFVFDTTLTYPCFSDFYDNVPPGIMIFVNIIPSAFILILYFKHLYKKVDRAMSLESNSDDEWGVL